MSGNKNIIIDECFNVISRPETITKDVLVWKTSFMIKVCLGWEFLAL